MMLLSGKIGREAGGSRSRGRTEEEYGGCRCVFGVVVRTMVEGVGMCGPQSLPN